MADYSYSNKQQNQKFNSRHIPQSPAGQETYKSIAVSNQSNPGKQENKQGTESRFRFIITDEGEEEEQTDEQEEQKEEEEGQKEGEQKKEEEEQKDQLNVFAGSKTASNRSTIEAS